MLRTENQSSPLSLSMESFPPSMILTMDSRGAFFDNLAQLLKVNCVSQNEKIQSFENLALSKNECAYVNDFRQNKLIFKKGFEDLLGYDEKEVTLDLIRQLYHPNDREIANRVYKAAILHSLNHPKDSGNSTLFITFRIRKKDGSYIKILSKSTIYELDATGMIISSLVKFTNISFIDKTDNVNWEFKTKSLMKDFFKQQVYKAYQNFFTNREKGIILKIEKGLTNKEISKKLNISEHTVATHRKNILKKAKCHSSEELIIFCKGKGIL